MAFNVVAHRLFGPVNFVVMRSEMNIDCAAASDGGSLMLVLPEELGGGQYILIRSIASRNTDQFERISGPQGILSSEEEKQLGKELSKIALTIQSTDPCTDVLEEFIVALKGRNGPPVHNLLFDTDPQVCRSTLR